MKLHHTDALAAGDRLNLLEAALVHGKLGRRSFIKMAVATGAIGLVGAQARAQELGDAAITQRYNAQL
jgi:choline dehydrogenase